MKSKTSLFNRTIIVNLLQRYWVAFALYFCIIGGCVLIPLLNALQQLGRNGLPIPYYAALYELMGIAPRCITLTNFLAAPVAAALLFSYLYNARHTGMMTSLPIKRETMYCSVSAAAMAGMLLCSLVVLVLALILELIYGQVHLGALGMLLGISAGSIVAFFGLAAFCCMLTGNIFAGPAVYFIFNFITIGVESLVYELLQKMVYGINNGFSPVTTFLSPAFSVIDGVNFDVAQIRDAAGNLTDYTWKLEGVGALLIYAAVGALFLWIGLLLYKNRSMETAGDTISIEILKPVFRICCTVGAGLLFAVFVQGLLYQVTPTAAMASAYIVVLLIIGGTLGYFISKMLIEKTVDVFRSGWKTVLKYALCVVVLVACIETDTFGFERKVPHISDVESVEIYDYNGNNCVLTEEETIQAALNLHESIIRNKSFHEQEFGNSYVTAYLSRFSESNAAFTHYTIRIAYNLNNGKIMTRRYHIKYGPDEIRSMESDIRSLEALLNTEEAINSRLVVDYPVTMDNVGGAWIEYVDAQTIEGLHYSDFAPSQIAKLYNECILPDIADGKLGMVDIIEDKDYALSKYNCTIALDMFREEITVNGYASRVEYRNIAVYPTLEASRTLAFLKELGIEPAVVYDSAVARGYDYNDLGRYRIDETEEPFYDKVVMDMGLHTAVPRSASSIGIIGGADGPTEIYVANG